ncbi:MAG: MFS transporter, partial [Bacteroidetes bacterium]|nr:MFS transporter [Bacteroidota bacterium]
MNAYSGLSPSTWWLSLVMLVNRCGTMVFPFMTLYLTEKLNISIPKAGFVVAIFGMGAICGGFIGGKLTDKFSFYFIQIASLISGGIMFLILGEMTSYWSICTCTFILGVLNESFRPANAAAIAHYSKEENRTKSYSLNRLAINLGWTLGGALGGFIVSHNYHLLFWIDGFTNIGAAFLLWILLAPSKNKATAVHPQNYNSGKSTSAYRDKYYLFFIMLTMIFAYCFFQLFTTMPLFFKRELHLSEVFIGITMAMNGFIIVLFEMVIIHNLEGKRNSLQYIALGSVLCAISFLVFNLLPGTISLAIISTLIMAAGEIISMPFMNTFWVGRTNAGNRGQYAGLFTIAWSIAQVLGPATGSQIADKMGFSTLWWITGGAFLISATGYK